MSSDMEMDASGSTALPEPADDTPPEKKSPLKIVGLSVLFVFIVLLCTVFKLPQARVTSLLQGYVQIALDPYGIYVTDRGRELSTLHGFRYTLDHPTLEFADQTRVELDDLVVTPNFLPLLNGRMGVNATLHQGPASIVLEGAGRGDKIDMKIDLDHVDLGKFGVFSYLANLKGSGLVTGSIALAGSLSDIPTLVGSVDLKIKNLKLDEQNLMGFQLPPLQVSDGSIVMSIQNGKLVIKTFQLGKARDDLILNLTGDITLNRFLNSSVLNLKTNFALSDRVKQSLALLESLLGSAKTADGKYAYRLTGTLASPMPIPDVTPGK
jgi:type II secretion system protein N